MAVAVTKTTIAALNADQTLTANAATSETINEAEVFTITPTASGGKLALMFYNGAGHGAITYSIAAGDFWASIAAVTGSIAAGAIEVLELDTAKIMQNDGTIAVTLTPASGKRLLTDHASGMYVLELL
jgi:hypothetical protein